MRKRSGVDGKSVFLLVLLGLLLAGCSGMRTGKSDADSHAAQSRLLEKLRGLSSITVRQFRPSGGPVVTRGMRLHIAPEALDGDDDLARARHFLQDFFPLLDVDRSELLSPRVETASSSGCQTIRFRQSRDGIPVWNAGVTLAFASDGSLLGVYSRRLPGINTFSKPRISADEAATMAFPDISPAVRNTLRRELVILSRHEMAPASGKDVLSWHFIIGGEPHDLLTHVFVGARGGKVRRLVEPPRELTTAGECLPALELPLVHLHEVTGIPDALFMRRPGGMDHGGSSDPVSVAFAFLEKYPEVFLTGNPRRQLHVREIRTDSLGMHHVITDQYYGGLPVFGGGLNFTVDNGGRLMSVTGIYVPGLWISVTPALTASESLRKALEYVAASTCEAGCSARSRGDARIPDYLAIIKERKLRIEPVLGIFPGSVVKGLREGQGLEDHLAWRVELPGWTVYVDAKEGNVVYGYPSVPTQTIHAYDAAGADEADYVPGIFSPLTHESTAGDAAMARRALEDALGYFEDGRLAGLFPIIYTHNAPWDPNNGDLYAITNLGSLSANPFAASTPCIVNQNAHSTPRIGTFPSYLAFCADVDSPDIVVHELFHQVTDGTAGLIYADESGALNESFSDVFGELIAGDPAFPWIHGEAATATAAGTMRIRNLRHPGVDDSAGNVAQDQPDNMGDYLFRDPVACPDLNDCDNGHVHTNSGIANRAAAILAENIGNDKVAAFYMYALDTHLREWSGFSDLMLGAYGSCLTWLERDGWPASFTPGLAIDDCTEIRAAFAQVGISPELTEGWIEHPWGMLGSRGNDRLNTGIRLYNGCTLEDVRIRLQTPDGERIADAGNNYSFDYQGEFGVSLAAQDWQQGGTSLEMRVHWWHNGFRPVVYTVTPVLRHGLNINTDAECYIPAGTEIITLRSDWVVHDYDLFNAKGNDIVRPSGWDANRLLPPRCLVRKVTLERKNDLGQVEDMTSRDGDAAGAYVADGVTVRPSGTDPAVNVRWWTGLENLSAVGIRYRARYEIAEPHGMDCSQSYY